MSEIRSGSASESVGSAPGEKLWPELFQRICDHPLLSCGVTDIDLIGEDLSSFALDQAHRLGEVLGARRRVPVVVGDGRARVDRDDVCARPRQPDAVRTALPACGSRHIRDLSCQWYFVIGHADSSFGNGAGALGAVRRENS
jgi:hypothetical protein